MSAPLHLVDGIPISKNGANLKLGDEDNTTVQCLELQVETQLDAPLAILNTLNVDELIATTGATASILMGSNLDLNNNMISNLNKLSLGSGATGSVNQVLSLNSNGDLVWKNDAEADVAQWATYPAVQGVDMNYQDLNNTGSIFSNTLFIKKLEEDENFRLIYDVSVSEPSIPALKITNTESEYGYISGSNIEAINSVVCQNISIMTDATLLNTSMSISSSVPGIDLNYVNNIEHGNLIKCNQLMPNFKLNNVFYVSSNGNTGGLANGSIENPYPTIQSCIDACEALTSVDNVYRYIRIAGGSYNEDLTITKKVFLVGMGMTPYSCTVGCSINGNISINVDANGNDMFNNFVNLQGLLINGKINNVSSQNAGLNLENCYIYTPDDEEGQGLLHNPSSTNSRLRMWNTQIISGGTDGSQALVEITSNGSLIMNNCYLSAKGLQNCLRFSGTANCDTIANCKFECSNTNSSVLPLVDIRANSSSTYTFGVCAFFYSSNTSKTANANACGILNNNGSGNNNILINYCSFFLLGTNTSNFAIQDANAGTATQMICLYYMNNASLNNAFAIRGTQNVNKFQLTVVS